MFIALKAVAVVLKIIFKLVQLFGLGARALCASCASAPAFVEKHQF